MRPSRYLMRVLVFLAFIVATTVAQQDDSGCSKLTAETFGSVIQVCNLHCTRVDRVDHARWFSNLAIGPPDWNLGAVFMTAFASSQADIDLGKTAFVRFFLTG